MGRLRVQPAHDMAPRAVGATLLLDLSRARQAWNKVRRIEIAELVKQAEPASGWLAGCGFIHTPTLWQGPGPRASSSFTHSGCGTAVKITKQRELGYFYS